SPVAPGTSRPFPGRVVNGTGPSNAKGRARSALKAVRNAAFTGSFTSASVVPDSNTILSPLAKTTDANPPIGLGGAGGGICFPFDADVPWLAGPPVDLKIFPRNTNTAATAAQSKTTKTNAATGKCFSGAVAAPKSATAAGIGRSPTFVPVMINFGSSVLGACGAVIFWKHVGHSITVPLCVESHWMCWPQTGHTYLNSLMVRGDLCLAWLQHPIFKTRLQSGIFMSDFSPGAKHIRTVEAHEKNLSRFPQRTLRARPRRGRGTIHRI